MLANGFNSNKLFGVTELSYEKIGKIPNRLNLEEVAMITRAISGKYSIFRNYLSNNSTKHDERNLVPLAIMYDGTSWMFRAFDRFEKKKISLRTFTFQELDSHSLTHRVKMIFSSYKQYRKRMRLCYKINIGISGYH